MQKCSSGAESTTWLSLKSGAAGPKLLHGLITNNKSTTFLGLTTATNINQTREMPR